MTYIITGTADLLNWLKDELAKNGYGNMDKDTFAKFLRVYPFSKLYVWDYTGVELVGWGIYDSSTITLSNQNYILEKILNK